MAPLGFVRKCFRYICLKYFKEQLYGDYKTDKKLKSHVLACCYSEFTKQRNGKIFFIINRSLFFNIQFKYFYSGDLQDFPF